MSEKFKGETEPTRPENFNELLDHLRALKSMLGDEGVYPPLHNFKLLANGNDEEGERFLKGKPQFNGWRPEHFQALIDEFKKE
jgi:hypothetical protein